MFEHFTQEARAVVIAARDQAQRLDHPHVAPVHLLLALTEGDSRSAQILHAKGLDADSIEESLAAAQTVPGAASSESASGGPLTEQDARALAALGIDLAQIRASIERAFGPGALDRVVTDPRAASGRRTSGRPFGRRSSTAERPPVRFGSHVPFTPGSKKTLELTLREALRFKDVELRSEHIALGLLRAGDPDVGAILARLGVDPKALRSDLEAQLSA